MTNRKIINLFDKIFISVSIFLLIYAWINFFIRNLWVTFLLSLSFTFASVFLLFYFLDKKNEKKSLSKKHAQDIEEKFLAFRLLNKLNKLKLLKSIIEKTSECKKVKDSLIYFENNKNYQILISTHMDKLTQFELENLIQNLEKNIDVLKIICCNTDSTLNTKILKNLEIEIITKTKLYNEYFYPHGIFPNCSNLNKKNERKKFKEIMKNFITPQKAKSYFLCGLVLIFSSIILPFKTYYLIFGSILLTLCLCCKLKPLFNH